MSRPDYVFRKPVVSRYQHETQLDIWDIRNNTSGHILCIFFLNFLMSEKCKPKQKQIIA